MYCRPEKNEKAIRTDFDPSLDRLSKIMKRKNEIEMLSEMFIAAQVIY